MKRFEFGWRTKCDTCGKIIATGGLRIALTGYYEHRRPRIAGQKDYDKADVTFCTVRCTEAWCKAHRELPPLTCPPPPLPPNTQRRDKHETAS